MKIESSKKRKPSKSGNLPDGDEILCALADIALGRRAYPETEKNGGVNDRLPTIAERMKGLEQLCRCLRLPEADGNADISIHLAGDLEDYAG